MALRRLDVNSAISLLGRETLQTELDKDTYYLISVGSVNENRAFLNHIERFVTTDNPFEYLVFNNNNFVIWLLESDSVDLLPSYENLIDEFGKLPESEQERLVDPKDEPDQAAMEFLFRANVPLSWSEDIWKKLKVLSKYKLDLLYDRLDRMYVCDGDFEKLDMREYLIL